MWCFVFLCENDVESDLFLLLPSADTSLWGFALQVLRFNTTPLVWKAAKASLYTKLRPC